MLKVNRWKLVALLALWMGSSAVVMPLLLDAPPTLAQSKSSGLSWSAILKWFRSRRVVRAGSRDPWTFGVAPAHIMIKDTDGKPVTYGAKVWDSQPLFVWRGSPEMVVVRHFDTQQLLWEAPQSPGDRWILYAGEPLKAGERYVWQLRSGDTLHDEVLFEVATVSEQQKIQADLAALAQQLQQDGTMTPEQLALHRAEYFRQLQYGADALREVYQLEHPPSELLPLIRLIVPTANPSPSASVMDSVMETESHPTHACSSAKS